MKYLIALLLFCSTAAWSQTFGLHVGSQHSPDPGGHANNLNPGAFVRFDDGVTLGFYRNSIYRESVYAAVTTREWNRLRLTYGVINGYISDSGPTAGWMPFVLPSVRVYSYEEYNVLLAYLPPLGHDGQSIYHLIVERRFK
jgi:hypothetical protein